MVHIASEPLERQLLYVWNITYSVCLMFPVWVWFQGHIQFGSTTLGKTLLFSAVFGSCRLINMATWTSPNYTNRQANTKGESHKASMLDKENAYFLNYVPKGLEIKSCTLYKTFCRNRNSVYLPCPIWLY